MFVASCFVGQLQYSNIDTGLESTGARVCRRHSHPPRNNSFLKIKESSSVGKGRKEGWVYADYCFDISC